MNTELLEKIKLLPLEKQQEFENYAEFLLQKYEHRKDKSRNDIAEKRRKNFGNMRGQIWMADDFNETPDDFKDYI